jgi:hypothetical protein
LIFSPSLTTLLASLHLVLFAFLRMKNYP